MSHPDQDELTLHYYGESDASVVDHLAACEECRTSYHRLQRVLNSVDGLAVPERPADYEDRVWRMIAPKLDRRPPRTLFGWGSSWWRSTSWWNSNGWMRLVPIGATAALLLVAFFAGRYVKRTGTGEVAQGRDRVLFVAVGDHLERSRMVLVELTNAVPRVNGSLDISFEQSTAEDLIESNRLYRQTALSNGDRHTADLLDDLERVLIEIAHGPSSVSARELADLRQEIQDRGILMKVSVFGSELEEQERNPLL